MTDDDLIQLLAEKSPREFTLDELKLLQERVQQSAEIRQAIASTVELEGQLSAAFGAAGINVEKLWLRAELLPVAKKKSAKPWWWALVGLTACILVGWYLRPQPPQALQEIVTETNAIAHPIETNEELKTLANRSEGMHSTGETATSVTPESKNPATASTDSPSPDSQVTSRAPTHPEGPWTDWLAADSVPLALEDPRLMGDLRTMDLDHLTVAEFQAWWAPLAGQPANLNQDTIGNRPTVKLDGWWSLKAPWLADTQLRMTPFDVQEQTLYFWQGEEGVALKFYREREPHLWAAFQVRRQPGKVDASSWGLLTTDSGAFFRSGAATWDVSHHDQRLMLSVGGMVILSVPFLQTPADVVLHAQMRVRGFQWVRAAAPSESEIQPGSRALSAEQVADEAWMTSSPETAMLQREVDGSIRLTSTDKSQVVRAFFPLETPGLLETMFQVSEADPGTGIFLGNESGQPIGLVSFCRDRRTGTLTVVSQPGYEKRIDSDYDFRTIPPPYYVADNWYRVTTGLGTWHTWVSADRRHWGRMAENPVRGIPGAVRTLGLYCLPADTPRSIRLQGLDVRKLEGFLPFRSDLPDESFPTVDLQKTRQYDDWMAAGWMAVASSGLSPQTWHDAWAVRTLEQGPSPELAMALVDRLIDSSRRLNPSERISFLNDTLVLCDTWGDDRARRWEQAFASIPTDQPDQETLNNSDALWQRWIKAPLWSYYRSHPGFDQRRSEELLRLAFQRSGHELARSARCNEFWTATAHPDHTPRDTAESLFNLSRWGKGLAVDMLGGTADAQQEVLPIAWRHPWSMQLNKEAYNVHAELLSALHGESYGDACRIISGIQLSAISGLIPDGDDPSLFVTLPIALERLCNRFPELPGQIPAVLEPTGQLRWQQAATQGDAAAMALAALQFWGTPTAARAHMWLGDRAMSLGDPVKAVVAYHAAQTSADDQSQKSLQQRLQLASIALGLPFTDDMGAAQFEGLSLAELASARPVTPQPSQNLTEAVPDLPLTAARYSWEKLARFDGQSGQNAGRGEYRSSDVFGRQLGISSDANHVFISNRFQITAYSKTSGTPVWSRGVDQDQGEAHAFAFTAMTPVVMGDRLYCRRLTKSGIELACLNSINGQLHWAMRLNEKAHWISDPIVIGPYLWALSASPGEQDLWDISWIQIQTSTGTVETSTPLARLRAAWDQEVPATLAMRGLDVVANVGGIIVKFDLAGHVHWLRRETWLPPRIDPQVYNQSLNQPIMRGQHVFLCPINSRRILCLDIKSGGEIWSQTCSDAQSVVAVRDTGVLVARPAGLTLLDPATGESRWTVDLEKPLLAMAWHQDSIYVTRQLDRKDKRGWIQFEEIEASTGAVRQSIPWEQEALEDHRLGPWFQVGPEIWGLTGSGFRDPHRDLIRLTPRQPVTDSLWNDPELGTWQNDWATESRRELQLRLPGWQAFGVSSKQLTLPQGEVRGVTGALQINLDASQSLHFVRSVTANSPTICELVVGHDPSLKWQLTVLLNGQIVHATEVSAEKSSNSWLTLAVPLNPQEKIPAILEIRAEASEGKNVATFWQMINLKSVSETHGAP